MTNISNKISLLKKANPEFFSILNLGKRGVGKTVFIAGSYIELNSKTETANPEKLWFELQETQESENVKIILDYIDRNGKYPPPTLKISSSSFSLKQKNWLGIKTLCDFIWSDIPGEICSIDNLDFRKMVFNSHGCSVFIDAPALVYQSEYQQELEEIIKLITPLITLSHLNNLKYTFAFILTKCDLLEDEALARQRINEKLEPLITHLRITSTKYQIFYSSIPLVTEKGVSSLRPKGASDPLVWLVRQIRKNHSISNSFQVFEDLRPKQLQPPEKTTKSKNIFLSRLISNRKHILVFAIIIIAIAGGTIALFRKESMGDRQQNIKIETNTLEP